MTAPNSALLAAALDYARRGWRVFPVKGKLPRIKDWPNQATTDEVPIRQWWDQWPSSGIAISTGRASSLVVLDVDSRKGGDASLAELVVEHGQIPLTNWVHTGGGGRHIYFAHPGGAPIRNRVNAAPGLDIRADGGYVVAPPSVHESGHPYTWAPGLSPEDVVLAPIPKWLLDLLQQPRPSSEATATGPQTPGERILEGARNSTLTRIGGAMRRHGATVEEIDAALQIANQNRCSPPLPSEVVAVIAQSVGRYLPTANHKPNRPSEKIEALFDSIRTLRDRVERPSEIPHPLIPDFVWPQSISMIYGPTGVGKTTLVVNIALHALGAGGVSDPQAPPPERTITLDEGFPLPTGPLRVFYLGAEDSLPMFEHLRLTPQLLEHYTIGPEARERFQYLLGRIILAAPRQEDVQLEALIQRIMERGPVDLIFLDPLTRFHLGFDENDNGQMAQVMAALDEIRERTGAAVIVTHHTGKMASRMMTGNREIRSDPTAARGAVVLADQSHVIYSLARGRGQSQTLVLTSAKSNYAPRRRPLVFERTEGGVLRPIANDTRLLEVRTIVEKAGGGSVKRQEVVKAVAGTLEISDRRARGWVDRAEEQGYVIRVAPEGEPSEDGDFLAVPQ